MPWTVEWSANRARRRGSRSQTSEPEPAGMIPHSSYAAGAGIMSSVKLRFRPRHRAPVRHRDRIRACHAPASHSAIDCGAGVTAFAGEAVMVRYELNAGARHAETD